MDLVLCYKSYPAKMSLGAMKNFKDETGLDLWCTLLQFIECFGLSDGESTVTRLRKLQQIVDFHTAAKLIHSLVKSESSGIPLCEIEDAMYRCGWMPNDNDQTNPWPLIIVSIAHKIDKQFTDSTPKKKADTSEAQAKT